MIPRVAMNDAVCLGCGDFCHNLLELRQKHLVVFQATVAYRIRGLNCDISNKLHHYLFYVSFDDDTGIEQSDWAAIFLQQVRFWCSGVTRPLPLNARVWLTRLH